MPDWLPTLRADIAATLADIKHRSTQNETRSQNLRVELADAEQHLALAQRRLDPHRRPIERAAADTRAAQERVWSTFSGSLHLKGRHRRAAVREHRLAEADLAAAKQREAEVRAVASPASTAVGEAATRVRAIEHSIEIVAITLRWTAGPAQVQEHQALLTAVDDWERWAAGQPIARPRLASMLDTLHSALAADCPECTALAAAVNDWSMAHKVDLGHDRAAAPAYRRPVADLGIEL